MVFPVEDPPTYLNSSLEKQNKNSSLIFFSPPTHLLSSHSHTHNEARVHSFQRLGETLFLRGIPLALASELRNEKGKTIIHVIQLCYVISVVPKKKLFCFFLAHVCKRVSVCVYGHFQVFLSLPPAPFFAEPSQCLCVGECSVYFVQFVLVLESRKSLIPPACCSCC